MIELIAQIPKESVLHFVVTYKEFVPELEALEYTVPPSGAMNIALTDQQSLEYLIRYKNLLNQTDHFDITYNEVTLLTAYDRMQSMWFSTEVIISEEFIKQYKLELEPDKKWWVVTYCEPDEE